MQFEFKGLGRTLWKFQKKKEEMFTCPNESQHSISHAGSEGERTFNFSLIFLNLNKY